MIDDTDKPAGTAAEKPAEKPEAGVAAAAPAAKSPARPRRARKTPAVTARATAKRPAAATQAKPASKTAVAAAAATKPAPAKKAAAASKATAKAAPDAGKKAALAKPGKTKKPKLVRDSFTMPENEYDVIAALKKRCLGAGMPAKKSEILRAAIANLAKLSDTALLAAVRKLEVIKTGRPAKGSK